MSWSRGSDWFTHPVTKSVTNRIVRNPPPCSDPDWDSSSWTREVSELDRGWDSSSWTPEVSELDRDSALSWSRGSDWFTHPVTKSVTNRIVRNPPPCSDPDWDSSSWTPEVSELDRGWDSSSWTPEVSQLDRDSALSWSRGSDWFTHPVTKSVTNRIVRNPPPCSDPDWDSSSWTPEVSELDRGWDSSSWTREVSELDRDPAQRWSRGSDSFTHPVTNSLTNRIVRNPPPGSDPEWYSSSWTREVSDIDRDWDSSSWTREVSELDRDPAQRWSRGSDSFTHPVTNSVTNRIVRNPPPYSDHDGDSSSWTREVSQLFTWDESDSVSQFRRDPAITLSKWLENFLIDSSIIVLEEKKEVVREVLREERERREERGRGAKVGRVERWMNHYSSFQKILLVGEGDFSFSACLAVAFGCAHNIIATSLDSREFLSSNYMNAMSNIESLTSRGAKVMHGVDATQMANHFVFDGMTFDRIVFNFPHGGFFRDESRETQLRRQRNLVRLFMKNAKKMIDKRGEIHVSHKSNSFFLEWNLEQLATNEGLWLIESLHFTFTDYPGYHTKYGFGGDKNFNCNPSKTYKFGLQN